MFGAFAAPYTMKLAWTCVHASRDFIVRYNKPD